MYVLNDNLSLSLSLSFHPPQFLLAMQLPLSTLFCSKSQSLRNLIGKDPSDGAMEEETQV